MARPKLVRLRKPKIDDETVFIRTLVAVLAAARQGKVNGYAMVFDVETPDGRRLTTETACVREDDPTLGLILLGGIERMKVNFMDRVWGAPNSEKEIG